jgi:hypothetical protein
MPRFTDLGGATGAYKPSYWAEAWVAQAAAPISIKEEASCLNRIKITLGSLEKSMAER